MLKGKVAPKTVCKADTAKPVSIVMGMVARPSNYREPGYELQGTVLNEKNEPVPYATIVSETGKNAVADSAGHFAIELVPGKNLTISSVGYEAKTFSYDSISPTTIKKIEVDKKTNTILMEAAIQLKQAAISPDEVVVVGGGVTRCSSVMAGALTTVYKTTLFQKETKPLADFPALKIFPNPIQPGQSFQINLQVKKPAVIF